MSVTPLDGFVLNGSEYEMRDKLAQARIDNLVAQNNPTDGNTELLDIRVGADGHTYDSAGQAVRSQIEKLQQNIGDEVEVLNAYHKNLELSQSLKDEYTPIYDTNEGFLNKTTGIFQNSASYKTYGVIPLFPKQILNFTSYGSENTAALVRCDKDKSNAVVVIVGTGNAVIHRAIMNTTEEVQYYMTCSYATFIPDIKISNKYLLSSEIVNTTDNDVLSQFYHNDGTLRLINFAEDVKNTNNYVMTTPILLNKGSIITFKGTVSSNIPAILRTNELCSEFEPLVQGDGSKFYSYTAVETEYVVVQYMIGNPFSLYFSHSWNEDFIKTDVRKAVVSFSFDDGGTDDYKLHDLFVSKNLKCGFALIAGSDIDDTNLGQYLQWQKEGFSILSHSTDSVAMNTEDLNSGAVKTKMLNSKARLEQRGFDIHGWVTPSSELRNDFLNSVRDLYEFSYTTYYGSYPSEYNGGNAPYCSFSDDPSQLYRVHFGGTSLDKLKEIVEMTIENHGWLNIYWHSHEITTEQMTKMDAFLDYLNTKIADYKMRCLAPNIAYDYFFSVRKQDI